MKHLSLYSIPFYFLLLFGNITTTKEVIYPKNEISSIGQKEGVYQYIAKADLNYGAIGIDEQNPIDNPQDNLFHIQLDSLPQKGQAIYLRYDLRGVRDHQSVPRSINDARSVGGYFIKENNRWSTQVERIPLEQLKKGDNVIRFAPLSSLKLRYEVMNLSICYGKIEKELPSIVINRCSPNYFGNQAYIKGVTDNQLETITYIELDGQLVPIFDGEFDLIIPKVFSCLERWHKTLTICYADGSSSKKQISFIFNKKIDHCIPFQKKEMQEGELFIKGDSNELATQNAGISILKEALDKDEVITITPLRNNDLAILNTDIVNVTKGAMAYRFLPDGLDFKENVKIQMAYDKTLIPDGFTADDIQSFFFDEKTRQWMSVEKIEVLEAEGLLVSNTTHFTDYINGIIKAPESPESTSFDANHIKGIEARSPAANVTVIPPPMANSFGTNEISFPIKITEGRLSAQPNLNITYSSNAGNSWIGTGWGMDIPSISIDTRWGIPVYDEKLETETYSIGGTQLSPITYQGQLINRNTNKNKRFYPRVENSFSRIIRHGSTPKDYWWEVTETNGTKHFYGGLPDEGVQHNEILKDRNLNIADWPLLESRDANGNFVRYHYTIVEDTGHSDWKEKGYELYLDRISYTGHNDQEGVYEVKFVRDRQLGEVRRPDVMVDCTLGFKQVKADLLREIKIFYKQQLIRKYELIYQIGAFNKMLLSSITEFDNKGDLFYAHQFEYFNEVNQRGDFVPYGPLENWQVSYDDIKGDLISEKIGINNETSSIGGGKGNNWQVGVASTVGTPGSSVNKYNTIGGHFYYMKANNTGLITLIDIDGDGKKDKVFKQGGKLWFRSNLSDPQNQNPSFGTKTLIIIPGVSDFSESITTSKSTGIEANVGKGKAGAFVSKSVIKSKTRTSIYFTDFNGDGLIDLAVKGRVFFNFINRNGVPEFTEDSNKTLFPILSDGNTISDSLKVKVTEEEITSLADENPLHDVVRMWKVPFDGEIIIDAPIQMMQDTSEAYSTYEYKDGVRARIEYEEKVLIEQKVPSNSTIVFPMKNTLKVKKGKLLFFRLQSIEDGAFDKVNWNPSIKYTNNESLLSSLDANGNNIYQYNAATDFLLSSPQTISMPFDGIIRVTQSIKKALTSDNVNLQIILNREGEAEEILNAKNYLDSISVNETFYEEFAVKKYDVLNFKVHASTNIDWKKVTWTPEIAYVSAPEIDPSMTINSQDTAFILNLKPAVDYNMYNHVGTIVKPLIIERDKEVKFGAYFNIPFPRPTITNFPSGKVTFSLKSRNKLIAKATTIVIENEYPTFQQVKANVMAGDTLFAEIHVDNWELFQALKNNLALLGTTHQVGIYSTINPEEIILGPLYRGWGQFVYKGNGKAGEEPIQNKVLKEAFKEYENLETQTSEDPEDIEESLDPTKKDFVLMFADINKGYWRGYDDLTFVGAGYMSSSRMGEDNINEEVVNIAAGKLSAIIKINESRTDNFSGKVEIEITKKPFSPKGTYTKSSTHSSPNIDNKDMNKDEFPDYKGNGYIQFSRPDGTLGPKVFFHELPSHTSESKSGGFMIGSKVSGAKNTNTQSPYSGSIQIGANSGIIGHNVNIGNNGFVGISGQYNVSEDEVVNTWIDINGDGLPDKVYSNGMVRLNYGRYFGELEYWDFDEIKAGVVTETGISIGGGKSKSFTYANGSIEGGLGLNKSANYTRAGLRDMNKDGLVDAIYLDDSFTLWVKLNTGTGFGTATKWADDFKIDEGVSTSESVNSAFTICFPLLFARICVNPSGSAGRNVSKQKTQLSDIDGDNSLDLLTSDNDGELQVRLSNIGKTNLLKTIKRPFNGSISMDYKRVGNTYEMPNSQWVLSEVAVYDGLGGDGVDVKKNRFSYEDGFRDRKEREFYGFGIVRVDELDTADKDKVYRSTIYAYHNRDYYQKGLLIAEKQLDGDGNLYTETINKYQLKDRHNGVILNSIPSTGSIFPALIETTTNFYEGKSQIGLQQKVKFEYDLFGNVILYEDFGNGQPEDYLKSKMTYHHLNNQYIHAHPANLKIITNEGVKRQRQSIIDNKGNTIKIRQYLKNGNSAEIDMEYDDKGNLIKIQRPANYNGERFTYEYQYDKEVQTYVVNTKDSYGYTSKNEYDYLFGQLLKSTDINGQEVIYELDSKGRIKEITGPYELASGADYTILFEYHLEAAVPYATTKHFDAETGQDIETITFIDGLLRPVQIKKTGLIFNTSTRQEEEKMIVSGRVKFDAFGRNEESYYPITENLGKEYLFNSNLDNISPTKTTYDILDRPLEIKVQDGSESQIKYDIANDQQGKKVYRTVTTDFLGNEKEDFKDVRGRQIAKKENGPNGEIWTKFQYNALGELLKIIDASGNEMKYNYNNFGNKLSYEHPDAGLTEWSYDLANNILTKTTANLRTTIPDGGFIRYKYEYERLVEIAYPKNIQNKVRYHYGKADAKHNRVGRIWLQEDASGGQEFLYGPFGEIEKNIRTVVIDGTQTYTYVSEAKYDTWNRIQEMIYPDGEKVDFTYNLAGKLNRMTGNKGGQEYVYAEQLGYDKFEQRILLKQGNGTETFYKYAPKRRRLQNIRVQNADGNLIMDNHYAYDKVGNILSLENKSERIVDLGGQFKHTYKYDPLYRLINADGQYYGNTKTQAYSLNMGYDDTHNILFKDQTVSRGALVDKKSSYSYDYEYQKNRPHIPTKIGDKSFSFDANGNQTGWVQNGVHPSYRQILWDEENRIKAIIDNGYGNRYTYDASGERVIKSHGGLEAVFTNGAPTTVVSHFEDFTVYVSSNFVARPHSYSKHYFIEGQRICSKQGIGEFKPNGINGGKGLTAGHINYSTKAQLLKKALRAYYQEILGITPGQLTLNNLTEQPEFTGISLPDFEIDTETYTKDVSDYPIQVISPDYSQSPGQLGISEYDTLKSDNVTAGYNYEGDSTVYEVAQYFYHPDHLGSSNYITDKAGKVRQFVAYIPFGEIFVEEINFISGKGLPYLFNGKEKDRETGLSYYGARFYDSQTSIWLSVDPMVEKYPNWSPYNYTLQNPVRFIDPDGREPVTFTVLAVAFTIGAGTEAWSQVAEMAFTGGNSLENHSYAESISKMTFSGFMNAAGLGFQKLGTSGQAFQEAISFSGDILIERFIGDKNHTLRDYGEKVLSSGVGKVFGGMTGKVRIGSNGKIYYPGSKGGIFFGNQYVSTEKLSSLLEFLGTTSTDGLIQLNEYLNKNVNKNDQHQFRQPLRQPRNNPPCPSCHGSKD